MSILPHGSSILPHSSNMPQKTLSGSMRYYELDFDSWYDESTRLFWMTDDPLLERHHEYNIWQLYNDRAEFVGNRWWWGYWEPDPSTIFPLDLITIQEAKEPGTRLCEIVEVFVEIRNWYRPTTFFRQERCRRSECPTNTTNITHPHTCLLYTSPSPRDRG